MTLPTHEQLAIAKSNGIPKKAVSQRIYTGWSVEDAITIPKYATRTKDTLVCGDVTVTKAQLEIAEENELNRKHIRSRLSSGWTVEDAINTPVKFRSDKMNDIDEDMLITIIARIKRINLIERDFPIPVPKPILKKANALGVDISRIKPVPERELIKL